MNNEKLHQLRATTYRSQKVMMRPKFEGTRKREEEKETLFGISTWALEPVGEPKVLGITLVQGKDTTPKWLTFSLTPEQAREIGDEFLRLADILEPLI